MKFVALVFTLLVCSTNLQAQSVSDGCLPANHIQYFNGFQHTKNNPIKINEALSHAQSLASTCLPSFQELLHNHFAPAFSKMLRKNFNGTVERKLLDSLVNNHNTVVSQTAKAIVLWVQIQENENNTAEVIRLTHTFIYTQLTAPDLFDNRIARYALLIYQEINQKSECSELAQMLLDKTTAHLQANLSHYTLKGEINNNYKRAWYRYLYAYANFLQAKKAESKSDLKAAEAYYRIAAQYSPDMPDKKAKAGYDYDIAVLIGYDKSNGFREDYLAFLENHPDSDQSLQILADLAITDPAYFVRLTEFYNKHYAGTESFTLFWEKVLKEKLTKAPDFHLIQLNNQPFSLQGNKGKWVLMDFWGTWCSPCLEEMPQLQAFYREILNKHADKLSLLAIACKDTEAKVKVFLNKHHYNFPVAMADSEIEKRFAVREYPTKILITPAGYMLEIPAGENWLEKVKQYCQF